MPRQQGQFSDLIELVVHPAECTALDYRVEREVLAEALGDVW